MALKHLDTVAGGGIIALGATAIWFSLDIGRGASLQTLPPNFFPLLCAGGLIVCGLILLIRGLTSEAGPLPRIVDSRIAVVGGLLIVFYWFFRDIDFRVGAAVLAFVTMWMFGIRSILQLVILPLGLAIGLYFAFTRGFGLVLPTWT